MSKTQRFLKILHGLERSTKCLLAAFIIAASSFVFTVVAAPPGSSYTAGETLDPACAPGDLNCTVEVASTGTTVYDTVVEAEAATGTDNDLSYVVETESYYRYEIDAATYVDENEFVLSTGDGGNTRWLAKSGQFNLGESNYWHVEHLDASSGSATITELNKIYYIQAASTLTTITIPDAILLNEGQTLRLYKESGNGAVRVQTVSGQNVSGASYTEIVFPNKGFYIKSDNATSWLQLQNSRSETPVTVNKSVDYGATENWQFDYLKMDTTAGDLTITFPADISGFPEGAKRLIFNTSNNLVFIDPNGNIVNGSNSICQIRPDGFAEYQKVDGNVIIIDNKYHSLAIEPDDVSNLELWIDADDSSTMALTGSLIDSINSKDASGTRTGTAAGTDRATLVSGGLNAKDTISYDGGDEFTFGDLEIHNNTAGRGLHIMAVIEPQASGDTIIGKYFTTGDQRAWYMQTNRSRVYETGNGPYKNSSMNPSYNEWQIVEMSWEPGGNVKTYVNGNLQYKSNGVLTDIENTTANLLLGDSQNTGNYLGEMAELFSYSRTLTNSERQKLLDYLAAKWNLADIPVSSSESLWSRDDTINTLSPDILNDNVDIGTGELTAGTITISSLLNAPSSSAAPVSPQGGSIYYDTDDDKLKVYNAGTTLWDDLN